jgi:hypothetical protein
LEELAKLPWVDVAPEPIRVLLLGVRKSVVLRKMVVRRDAMVQLAFAKASFGGDRSAAGRYAAEQRWKGHQKKDEMPKPSGFIGVRRPSERTIRDVDGKAPYPSVMSPLDLDAMLEDDMAEMNEQQGRFQDRRKADGSLILSLETRGSLESPANRRTAKQTLVTNLTNAVLSALPKEVLLTAIYELDRNPDDPPIVPLTAFDVFVMDPKVVEDAIYEGVNQIIHQWAESSNDHLRRSLAVQQVVERVFGLKDSASVEVFSGGVSSVDKDAKALSDPTSASGKFLSAVIRQQYADTQAYFEAKGIKEVTLYRGTDDPSLRAGEQEVVLRPLSSFSADRQVAYSFASEEGGRVLTVKVPVSQIFSTPFTGIGCLPEQEFVILGKPTTADVERRMGI